MPHTHITINQLIILEGNFHNQVKPLECAERMKIGKDKVYRYYKLFKNGKSVEEIYQQYRENKSKCGRKKIVLGTENLKRINEKLDNDWSLDVIAGRDKLKEFKGRVCTSTLYRMVKDGIIDRKKLRRLGRRNKNGHVETRGKNNTGKTIHERNEKYPNVKQNIEYGHFEGDTIIGKNRKSAIVTLVEKVTKCIILLKGSRKSKDVKNTIKNWLDRNSNNPIKTITFDRGKEFSKWKEMENCKEGLEIYFGDPGSPGQRGLNENSNGIVRKDLPKSTDLSVHSQEKLDRIAMKWNNIPRKILGYLSPMEKLEEVIGLVKIT